MPPKRPAKKGTGVPKSTGVKSLRIVMPSATPAPPKTAAPDDAAKKAAAEEDANHFSIASLTLDTPLRPFVRPRKAPTASSPFHFLSLPSELRMQIYAYYFDDVDGVIDLDPTNYRRYHKKLGLFRVCKRVHEEACYYFYSTRPFRLFSTAYYSSKYFKTKRPLLARLKQHQRQAITSLELRVGPGWSDPPKGWAVTPAMGLKECADVQKIKVYIQCDPSAEYFNRFRRSPDFYTEFCQNLLTDALNDLSSVHTVEFDAYPGIKKSGGMMQGLLETAAEHQLAIEWGPDRGWTDDMTEDDEDPQAAAAALREALRMAGGDVSAMA